jgi:tRNA(Ile)-lysidine synthase
MASSRKRSRGKAAAADLVPGVAAQLAGLVGPGDRLVAALSGGVDSVVLLDLLHRLSADLRIRLSALHVNHQLSPDAARWSAFCRRICRARRIPIRSVKVTVRRGDSLEAAARAARYAEFARQPCEFIALAHHQDDQVETLLLQLLRGAGVKGLAAMPLLRAEGGGLRPEEKDGKSRKADPSSSLIPHPSSLKESPAILRPLLDVTREQIVAYAKERRLTWVEDESNADDRIRRNFLRREVLPLVARRFPAYRTTIARAARHLAETGEVLAEVAAADGAGYVDDGVLDITALRRLSPARARNLLRHFLAGHRVTLPNAARLEEALLQILHARRDAQVLIDLGNVELRRFEGRLHVVATLAKNRTGWTRRWHGERKLPLPELGGALIMAPRRGEGVSLARLSGRQVTVRLRRGGERLQPDGRRPRRTLKNLLQEARVPPWARERLPLVFCGTDLVWVPGIGLDCAYQAAPDERAVFPEWRPVQAGFGTAKVP